MEIVTPPVVQALVGATTITTAAWPRMATRGPGSTTLMLPPQALDYHLIRHLGHVTTIPGLQIILSPITFQNKKFQTVPNYPLVGLLSLTIVLNHLISRHLYPMSVRVLPSVNHVPIKMHVSIQKHVPRPRHKVPGQFKVSEVCHLRQPSQLHP